MRRTALFILLGSIGCDQGTPSTEPRAAEEPPAEQADPIREASSPSGENEQQQQNAVEDEEDAQQQHADRENGEQQTAEWTELLAADGSRSTSIGMPSDGTLRGAAALPLRGPGFVFNPRRDPAARFGTIELVQALVRAAATVHRELGGEVTINDLSLRGGGPIPHHGSHRVGRDVDVLFYLLDAHGEPRAGIGAPIDPEGRGTDYRDLADPGDDLPVQIDLPRTWRFVQALIEETPDDAAPLQRVFVVEHLRTLLLAEAERAGAPAAVRQRFAELTCQPSYPHDDHFHFRFFCSREDMDRGCRESRPIYPWRRAALRPHDLVPRVARPRPDRPRAPITTAAEARAAAGPMHPSVRRFLRRRRAWTDAPHPGRRWCR